MKTFSFSPLFIAGALVATISGCAAPGSNPQGSPKQQMMSKEGCACCAMHKGGMSQGMNDQPMGMMRDNTASAQGGMCSPDQDAGGKGGGGCCAGMGKMDGAGGACGGMDKKEMSPDMRKQHMEMMKRHHPEMTPGYVAPPVTK